MINGLKRLKILDGADVCVYDKAVLRAELVNQAENEICDEIWKVYDDEDEAEWNVWAGEIDSDIIIGSNALVSYVMPGHDSPSVFWPKVWEMYEASFTPRKRRSVSDFHFVMDDYDEMLEFRFYCRGKDVIGLSCVWKTPRWHYLEFLAVHPRWREMGWAHRILFLVKHLAQADALPLVTVVEHSPQWRYVEQLKFYLHCGFKEVSNEYKKHRSYSSGFAPFPALVLSSTGAFPSSLASSFILWHKKVVMGQGPDERNIQDLTKEKAARVGKKSFLF